MKKDQTLNLPSGVEISFRVVRSEDAPALQRLHARCSERTIYLRFFGLMEKLSDEKARYVASIDGVDHFGINLMVFPVILGTGKKAFAETPERRSLRLREAKVVGDGIVVLVYDRRA